jgi:nitrogen fixation-related uncharacterized protein
LPGNTGPQYDKLDEQELHNKIKRHKRNVLIVVGIIVAVIAIAIAVILWAMDGITYNSYTISSSVNRDDTESANYTAFGSGYVRYSNDGISYYSSKGTAVWNQTYSMQKPQVKICGDCVAVGDINGSKIYIFNKTGMLGSVDTSLSISQIEVASQGVVAAVLEDNNSNYINLYNTDGAKIYTVKTTLSGDGYPLDISISEDATKLVASYLYVSGESMKTNVVFYNFSDVGQNETERIVGGFNHYDSTIVGDVAFLNKTTAVAVGENVVSIYKIKEYPSLSKEISVDSKIQRVLFSDKYIGLVLDNSESGELYKLVVYNLSGGRVCESTFSMQYDDIKFDGNSVILNNSSTLTLMNLKGKNLTNQTVDMPIDEILPNGGRGRYLMVNKKYIQDIKLK